MATHETLMRQWTMLRAIPRAPRKVDTATLEATLAAQGFPVDRRSIQRDLVRLSSLFPLRCDEGSKPYGWSWMRDAEGLDVPAMDPLTALTFRMAESWLEPAMPPAVLRNLRPHFERARRLLGEGDRHGPASWPDKVRVLPEGHPLVQPKVDAAVVDAVSDGLLGDRRLRLVYRKRDAVETREWEADPLALVVRQPVTYLVCTLRADGDVLGLPLHRIVEAEVLPTPARRVDGFDLDAWLARGGTGFPVASSPVRLVARVRAPLAHILEETPLTPDQRLVAEGGGTWRLEARVPHTRKLRAWVLGYGALIEVLEPDALRRDVAGEALAMARTYGVGDPARQGRADAGGGDGSMEAPAGDGNRRRR